MPGSSASTTLQYTGIGVFVAIVLLGLIYFSCSIRAGVLARRNDAATGQGVGTASPEQQRVLGLAPEDVALLPTFTYHAISPADRWHGGGDKAKAKPADSCAVCLDELREGALVRMLPSCKHYFHASCVDVWLLSHASCPVCRASPALAPAPEGVHLGVAPLSPPLTQLRRCGAASKGGDTSRVDNFGASRSSSPVIRSPAHSELLIYTTDVNSVMSPSATWPRTPDSEISRYNSLSPVTTGSHPADV
ncbi:RING-H2 finger protein ATL67 [Brachypodium distachyon]|uniref:RING-type E3 ubiquitin transferase n=1 Tax=Brachypodium distachyon TaxID=15368 RepID=A0A0Q3H5D6_BRADI|nr:RING-H2 finger protein ATL67 [Brachypodium distachyon]KQK18120.1 hypothetical protein BRADI_1g39000v3 [Brachypodium distachyon]|eukprot:XP_010229831.1 RING-H2 finger protein ATL67 [Brachypodium distachyon]